MPTRSPGDHQYSHERRKHWKGQLDNAVTCNVDTLPEESHVSELIQPHSVEDIKAARSSDPVINRVLTLKKTY